MFKNFYKTIAIVLLGSALSMSVATPAYAINDRYYSYATNLQDESRKAWLINRIVTVLERRIATYERIVNKYQSRYGHLAWFKRYPDRLSAAKLELTRWVALKNGGGSTGPSLVNTLVANHDYEKVTRLPEQLTDTTEREVETVDGDLIKVFNEITKTYTTPVVTKSYTRTEITKVYSDGSRVTSNTTKYNGRSISNEVRTQIDKVLVRQYAAVVEETTSEFGTPTTGVLTTEEYMAREDVVYAGTDGYLKALQNYKSLFTDEHNQRDTFKNYASNLDQVNAPEAWARGWTGKGSTIAILDTGIDMDHPEFEDRIVGTACLSGACGYETIDDINNVSHGTHVAGIAAAALDGVGMTGVAPDADLLIGKVSMGSYGAIDINAVARGLDWAADNGATVANVSANHNIDYTYERGVVSIGDGVYRSTDTRFSDGSYYNILSSTFTKDTVAAMSGNEMVLVAAAGNQGLDFSTFPAHLAVLENEDGSLALDGRVIVAGNYNPNRSNSLASTTNRAGTVCFDYNANQNTCNSDHRISDFYLMAPGTLVMSTVDGGEYMTLTGTSMSAPTISGGVALIHQMWPHMTGSNLVKLLLDTGDKSFAFYDENVHGQGLMDLDEATKPQGALGIPTTGRVDGNTTDVMTAQSLSIAGATVSALDELMVIDDYDRDFYVDGNDLNLNADTRTVHITKAAQDGLSMNEYAGYATGIIPLEFGALSATLGEDGDGFSVEYDLNDYITVGLVNENETFLGNFAEGALMDVDGATTLYFGYEAEQEVAKGVTIFGGATFGITDLNVNSNAAMKDASTALSNSARIGAKFTNGKSTFGLVAALPVAITDADATFETASAVSVSGDIQTSTVTSSLANEAREYSMGAFYNTALTANVDMGLFVEARNNYAGNDGAIRTEYGLKLGGSF